MHPYASAFPTFGVCKHAHDMDKEKGVYTSFHSAGLSAQQKDNTFYIFSKEQNLRWMTFMRLLEEYDEILEGRRSRIPDVIRMSVEFNQ